MNVPEHLWRHPTAAAIASLAQRFGLPNTASMQDWEYEVADADRIDAFLATYRSGELDDDERFVLMEGILQSFDELGDALADDPRWPGVVKLLEGAIDLHIATVWYWSCDGAGDDEGFALSPHVRPILEKHRSRFATPSSPRDKD